MSALPYVAFLLGVVVTIRTLQLGFKAYKVKNNLSKALAVVFFTGSVANGGYLIFEIVYLFGYDQALLVDAPYFAHTVHIAIWTVCWAGDEFLHHRWDNV